MAYKKYIKRNGKLYGPYIYHSRRVGGKVISEYQGTNRKIEYKKFIFIFIGIVFVLAMIYGVVSNKSKLTGNIIVDLEEENLPSITDLIITPLHEDNESIRKYDLDLEVFYEDNLSLNYDWRINCGYFFKDNESFGTEYSGSDNLIEWHATEECVDAVIRVDVLAEDNGQELEQPVFNPEDRIIINIRTVLAENETEIEVDDLGISPEITEPAEEVEIVEEIGIVRLYFLTEDDKQILINEFGDVDIIRTARLFRDRIVVKYELGNRWIENSYDANLGDEELERQMEVDRIKWLKDIIKEIVNEESAEQNLEDFDGSYPIYSRT